MYGGVDVLLCRRVWAEHAADGVLSVLRSTGGAVQHVDMDEVFVRGADRHQGRGRCVSECT